MNMQLDKKRREMGLTITQLHEKAGVSYTAMHAALYGSKRTTTRTRIYLADALNCKVEDIFCEVVK